ncbi:uncharacterized protein C16orf78 homolog isoform X2 [Lissotriton helveticus]
MSSLGRKKSGSAVVDWLDSKQAKTLRVSNERETFHIPSSMADLRLNEDPLQGSAHGSAGSAASLTFDQLPRYRSFMQQSTKTISNEQRKNKVYLPFSHVDLSMSATAPKPPDFSRGSNFTLQGGVDLPRPSAAIKYPEGLRTNTIYAQGSSSRYKKASYSKKPTAVDSSISLQEAIQIFPSLQKLSSSTGRNIPNEKIQLSKAMSGFPGLERRLKDLLVKAWEEEERSQRAVSLPHIRPEEILRCRYLRLSQNNINTLLKLCRESGLDVDLHPHMKESDIDLNAVMCSTSNSVSL